MRNSVAALMLVGALVATGCNPILRTHGYVPTADAKPQAINPNSDTKASVLASLGSPSVEGTFDEEVETDTWYYINQVRERYAYLRPQIQEQSVTAISFNADGQVTKVAEYGIDDRRVVDYESRETPTRGRELSVLEQIFGTIGRLPSDRIGGQQDVPGGGGGPR
ncbi:outer membrane protein assembly factor BamE [Algimonas ampicilliniresistens]|jgi:outer membrane protein assembly factor BamE (lipoprotein component of BamABCDE complex)|uniref:Outer membrane protein assembly factor BamE n=1 Tax=Algimonas ampicilliniresistens TaxID=1298735 RepID=A0ABQ5V8D5_9PROT|nr:outer membrane protein assembly factor BamE [Algimonas ampicilliniresistens]GLQ23282.1 outer membrane protein assembly factor BamE [Algimonas ampicilliniresistens]